MESVDEQPVPDVVASSKEVKRAAIQTKEDGFLDDLDETIGPGVFLCRWPNGDCSVVAAPTKRKAIELLGEWDAAEPNMLYPLNSCLFDLRLSDSAELVLQEVGKETRKIIFDKCYKELSNILDSVEADDLYNKATPRERKDIAKRLVLLAVRHERKRLWRSSRKRATKTESGRAQITNGFSFLDD